jgi:RNA polymerase sigma-70 factor (ECF subfamily)
VPKSFSRLLSELRAREAAGSSGYDDAAFERELLAVVGDLRAFGRYLAGSSDGGEDLAQQAVMHAWRARRSYQPGTSMRAWAKLILKNEFLNRARKAVRHRSWMSGLDLREHVHAATQDAGIVLGDMAAALDQLPDKQREAVLLIGADGMSYEDAADVLGCPVGTVKSRVTRGRTMLRRLMDGQDASAEEVVAG